MSSVALLTCLFRLKHVCLSGSYRDWDLGSEAVHAEGMVWPCEGAKAASSTQESCASGGEHQLATASQLCSLRRACQAHRDISEQ